MTTIPPGRRPWSGICPISWPGLPEELEHRLWSEIQTYEGVQKMTYVTSVERIGIRKGIEQGMQQGMQQGIQQGLQHERFLLMRLTRKRFGDEIASRSAPLLDKVTSYQALEDLAEAIMDCHDSEAWIKTVNEAAG